MERCDKSQEPKSQEPKSQEPKSQEPKSQEPKSREPKSQEPKSLGPRSLSSRILSPRSLSHRSLSPGASAGHYFGVFYLKKTLSLLQKCICKAFLASMAPEKTWLCFIILDSGLDLKSGSLEKSNCL